MCAASRKVVLYKIDIPHRKGIPAIILSQTEKKGKTTVANRDIFLFKTSQVLLFPFLLFFFNLSLVIKIELANLFSGRGLWFELDVAISANSQSAIAYVGLEEEQELFVEASTCKKQTLVKLI